MKKFIISSLLAAGFSLNADADVKTDVNKEITFEKSSINMGINEIIKRELPFTLMAHSSHSSHYSHSSHGSHASHGSHSSSYHSSHASHSSHYSHYSYGGQNYNYEPENKFSKLGQNEGMGRNTNSTPPESILPRSPAIVPVNFSKEKIKGSSKEFVILTQRVQLALFGLGYYSGKIDGLVNSELKSSIAKYQLKYNLKVTGSLTDELIGNLHVGAKLK